MPDYSMIFDALRRMNRVKPYIDESGGFDQRTGVFTDNFGGPAPHQQFDQQEQLPEQMRTPGVQSYVRQDVNDVNAATSHPAYQQPDEFHPSTRYNDMLEAQIRAYPELKKPGRWRSIAAALTAAAGAYGGVRNPSGNADMVAYGDRDKALADWQAKTNAIEHGVTNENADNTNARYIHQQQINQDLNDQRISQADAKIAETERAHRAQEETRAKANDIAMKRADIAAKVANGGIPMQDETGRMYMVFRDGTKLDVDVDAFSPKELEEARARHAESLAGVRGVEQRKNIAAQGGQTRQNIAAQGDKEKNVVEFKSSVPYSRGISETQKAAGLNTKAHELVSRHPEWAPYIKFDDKNKFDRVEAPKGNAGGLFSKSSPAGDPRIAQQVNDALYGSDKQLTHPDNARIAVIGPNGESGTMTAAEFAQFESKGWRKK